LHSVCQVNSEGFVDLRGLLRVINGFGSQGQLRSLVPIFMLHFHSKDCVHVCAACLTIFHHEKEIFARIFQIAIRNLKAVKVVIGILFA
jgi:hypothetical protein